MGLLALFLFDGDKIAFGAAFLRALERRGLRRGVTVLMILRKLSLLTGNSSET